VESRLQIERQGSPVSDLELLRAIGRDIRVLYNDCIKQPLPRSIEATLARIERQQPRIGYERHSEGRRA
jgi:hypothetical protein